MRIYMTKRRWVILFMIIGLVFVGCFLSYWQFIKPAQASLLQAKTDVSVAQIELAAAQNQEQVLADDTSVLPSAVLQQKLPVVPLEDDVIFALSQAEAIADVHIEQVNYQGNQSFPESNRVITFNEVEEPTEEEMTIELEPGEEEEPEVAEPIVDPELMIDWTIPNVEPIQALVQVRTSEYDGIAKFVQELEHYSRILSVDSISYESYKEMQDAGVEEEVETESFGFYVMVSSFYYPSLAETMEPSAPYRTYPDHSEKTDPLYPR
ncbi:hypothetical protein ACI2JA_16005 [Alkalihalobacillus sp. NPDC078783]